MTETEENPVHAMTALAKQFVEGVCQEISSFDDCYGDYRVDSIASEPYDGFIPYTNGGVDGVVYAQLSYAHGSGYVPDVIQPYIDSALKDSAEEFERKNGITVEEMDAWEETERAKWEMPMLPGIDRAPCPPQHALREALWEAQDSWLDEGGTYFYKVRIMFYAPENYRRELPGDSWEVRIFAMINTDFEYGRDSISWMPHYGGKVDQNTDTFSRTMPHEEFLALGPDGIDELITEAVNALHAS